MKFIIVEDNKDYQKKIADILLKKYFIYKIEIKKFLKYDKDLEAIILNLSEPKIYILDIELNDPISGIKIAKKIRKKDRDSFIIFITSHKEMFEPVFRNIYEVYNFIEKFDSFEDRFIKDIDRIMKNHFDNKCFHFHNNRIFLNIYYKEILYIERDTVERKLIIYTTDETYCVPLGLKQALEILDDRFKQVHKSCIVNTNRVTKYNWSKSKFTLDTKKTVPLLSRKYMENVKIK